MKPEDDPLKALFDALPDELEPIDPERQAKALARFQRQRRGLSQVVEEHGYYDPDAESPPSPEEKHYVSFGDDERRKAEWRSHKKPNEGESKPRPKDRPRRS